MVHLRHGNAYYRLAERHGRSTKHTHRRRHLFLPPTCLHSFARTLAALFWREHGCSGPSTF